MNSLVWEDMGVVTKVNKQIKNRWALVGLADSVGVALAGGVKVAPDEGRIE